MNRILYVDVGCINREKDEAIARAEKAEARVRELEERLRRAARSAKTMGYTGLLPVLELPLDPPATRAEFAAEGGGADTDVGA